MLGFGSTPQPPPLTAYPDSVTKWPELAREIADTVLFPVADSVDADGEIPPSSHFDALAADGFYGIAALGDGGPPAAKNWSRSSKPCAAVASRRRSPGCSITASSEPWRRVPMHLCASNTGTVWFPARFAVGGLPMPAHPPRPPLLWAKRVNDGYVLDGIAPFVTGWGIVDVLLVSARDEFDNSIVHSVVPVGEAPPGLTIEELPLIAARGSNTVRIVFDAFEIPDTDVCAVVSDEQFQSTQLPPACGSTARWPWASPAVLSPNSRIWESTPTRSRNKPPGARRSRCSTARRRRHVGRRARASELAIRASAALVTATGSRALVGSNTPRAAHA